MDYASVFPFSLNSAAELVILVRRDGDFYKDLGGTVSGYFSPIHAAGRQLLQHSRGMIAPSNIERLHKKKQLIPEDDEFLIREVLAKLTALPPYMLIRSISNHIGFLYPVSHIDPELLNAQLEDSSLHWIRLSILFSETEYQRFFSAFTLSVLSKINTNQLKQAISLQKEPETRVQYKVALLNLEDEAVWQYHFESMVLSNLFSKSYLSRNIRWSFFESDLPSSHEMEEIHAVVLYGWRDKAHDSLVEFLTALQKPIIAIGSGADLMNEIIGGSVETSDEFSPPSLKHIEDSEGQVIDSVLFFGNKKVVSVPEDTNVVGLQRGVPIIYSKGKVLCVHGHPEMSHEFFSLMFASYLVEKGLCSEDEIENSRREFAEMDKEAMRRVRDICEEFLVS